MTRGLVVVRPEPGNAATATAARTLGFDVVQLPFFAVVPLAWRTPDPRDHDALIVTSANAIRHGGAGLATLTALPVIAVGAASAAAAREAGFRVVATGSDNAAAVGALAAANGFRRPLHLGGRERVAIPGADAIAVYASEECAVPPAALSACRDRTVLLHSARAAARLDTLVPDAAARGRIALAGLSAAVIARAGGGWRAVAVAAVPTDAALLAALAPD